MDKESTEKGMMTVEVVVGLTIYVAFFVILLNFLNVIYIRQKFQAALKPVALQISREYEVNKELQVMASQGAVDKFKELEELRSMYDIEYAYEPSNDWVTYAAERFYLNIAEYENDDISVEYLEDMGIVGGVDGLSFGSSSIDEDGNGTVDLTLKYRIRIVNLPFFEGAGIDVSIEQHACTSLWK